MSKKKELPFIAKLKGGKLWIIILGAVLGVALLLYGGKEEEPKTENASDLEAYAASVEKKIEELCAGVDGVKNIKVAVSFESGFEYVYATDGDKTLTVGSGSGESAVIVTEIPPVIGGVGVVCRGGGNPVIQKRLIELISAAYGVSSNKIYIAEAQK